MNKYINRFLCAASFLAIPVTHAMENYCDIYEMLNITTFTTSGQPVSFNIPTYNKIIKYINTADTTELMQKRRAGENILHVFFNTMGWPLKSTNAQLNAQITDACRSLLETVKIKVGNKNWNSLLSQTSTNEPISVADLFTKATNDNKPMPYLQELSHYFKPLN